MIGIKQKLAKIHIWAQKIQELFQLLVFLIILSATCFAYVFRELGGDYIVEDLIHAAGLGSWGLLFLLMGMTFCLGFFLDWIEITLIVLPVFAPLVAGMDFGDHIAEQNIIFWFILFYTCICLFGCLFFWDSLPRGHNLIVVGQFW